MISPPKFYGGLILCVLINIILNGWGIYRGRLFIADQALTGLTLHQGALSFSKTLWGKIQGSPALNISFPRKEQTFIFTYTSHFPVPNDNTLQYFATSVARWVDTTLYVERCLQLESNVPPDGYLLYGNTVMLPDGDGVRGSLCQELFHDSAAYAQMDALCDGLACFRSMLLLGCAKPVNEVALNFWSLADYKARDCGRINQLTPGFHLSGQGRPKFDPDAFMDVTDIDPVLYNNIMSQDMRLQLGENNITIFANGGSLYYSCISSFKKTTIYYFLPSESGNYLFSFCGRTVHDTVLQIENNCIDDNCNRQSSLVVAMTGGRVYEILVADFNESNIDLTAGLSITKT